LTGRDSFFNSYHLQLFANKANVDLRQTQTAPSKANTVWRAAGLRVVFNTLKALLDGLRA
jgi:hypothetical protein